jgi:hypothetical protein
MINPLGKILMLSVINAVVNNSFASHNIQGQDDLPVKTNDRAKKRRQRELENRYSKLLDKENQHEKR